MTTYRIDYIVDGDLDITVYHCLSRDSAMKRARQASRVHGVAYAIAHRDGEDTGQRVYVRGHYSHTDDVF